MSPDDFAKDWYQIVRDGLLENQGDWIALPESRDETVRLCSLCSQFLDEWQASHFNLYVQSNCQLSPRWEQPTGYYGGIYKFHHHPALASLVESATSGQCDLCTVLLFAFVDWVENGTKPSQSIPKATLVPNMRLRVDKSKIPTDSVTFRLEPSQVCRFNFAISFPRPPGSDDAPAYGYYSPTVDYFYLSLYVTEPSTWRAQIVKKETEMSPHLTLPPRADVKAISASVLDMMQFCQENHPQCGRADPDFKPLRLVDVSRVAENQVRIVETSSMKAAPYIALSYCWGPTEEFRLKKGNYADCLVSIPTEKLPQTLLDATRFTNALGFRYIWIDAICIVQDDPQDWAFEAVRMKQVYQAASLCISALLSPSSVHGLFPQKRDWDGIRVAIGKDKEFVLQAHDFDSLPSSYFLNALEDSPMTSRGWTMQERFLSRKIVHVSHVQTMYECRHQNMPETGLVLDNDTDEALSLQKLYNSLETAPRPKLLLSWYHMIYEYGMRQFKHESDRLTAFDGMRQLFQPGIDCLYWNGLWTSDLYTGLLWVKSAGPMGSPCGALMSLGVPAHPGIITEEIPPCMELFESEGVIAFDTPPTPSSGHSATWCWASSLPGQLYFLLRDNGYVMTADDGYDSDDEGSRFAHPRNPTQRRFSIIEAGHFKIDTLRPFLRIRGFLVSLKQSEGTLRLHFGLAPDPTTFKCRVNFFPDDESLTVSDLDCAGFVVSQSDVHVPDEETQTWVRMCTLTVMVLRQSKQRPTGVEPVYERVGIIFFQGEGLSNLMNKRTSQGQDEFYII